MPPAAWQAIPDHFPHVALDAFVVMPDHAHGVIWMTKNAGAAEREAAARVTGAEAQTGAAAEVPGDEGRAPLPQHPPPTPRSPSKTLGSIVRGFKIGVTKWMRANTDVHEVWQRNYYEHIIRSEADLARIRAYIQNNPARWSLEK